MFIPRHPVIEDQFCSYAETGTSCGVGGVVAYAGTVVYLNPAANNEEPEVIKLDTGTEKPFGLLMQKVKAGYHDVHPSGFYMPGDLGSSDVIAQPRYGTNGAINGTKAAPVGVAHFGIWDTVHYTCEKTMSGTTSVIDAGKYMKPGMDLSASVDEGKLTNAADGADPDEGDAVDASYTAARVMKGASAAKCVANIDNVTLYPIRVKLVV